ncbi:MULTISPECIES: hypothetical protein [unclassified Halobacterium]|jgi:hypothetical protein|uniref:hypothetical protein n=1 Tax=unclassified Halobacterium TaxID=2668073 RepID=UPI001E2C26B4|nr:MULTISPECIES: hypothetical protein [unclassified Halobacterium]MCD2199649.1 hypothetical protein [Halobacterium sp. KA-4]MCD2203575.1 hypothetical protein [Halobacterium sp. KA-6]
MTVWADVTRAAMALNVVALLALCSVWVRNYRQIQSKHTLGLLVFGLLLLGENALGLYYFVMHDALTAWFSGLPSISATAMMALRLLETAAIVFLLWVTWD